MTLSKMTRTAFFAALVTMGAGTTGATAASSADELREALVGNTFQGGMGGGVYTSYFAEDGTYVDAAGGGTYEITEEGVCYPGTDFGCYAAQIDGNQLEWFQNGESVGSGVIEQGNTLE
ncbi:hypothetical protein [Halomonas saccharevitans]|uniref:MORN repeat-containing protein n=1 Tax=Halomonas saccharevitans TaxID=416872 RepID=A0A1I7A7W6_9GAMM|nr:hypothetical protein [Halomonas saccharevitans]SFT71035.1 hypothetical protein SAMN04487956_11589 [Halomonas saccharevitans]